MRSVITALLLVAGTAGAQSLPRPRWADAIDSMMSRELARTKTPGAQIAVVEGGRLAYTKAFGVADIESGRRVTDKTIFQTGSVGKLFTGMLLATLASDGKLDLRSPISRYVPELAGKEVGTNTLHELLTHSGGWLQNANPYGRNDPAAADALFRTVGDTILVPGLRGLYSYSNAGLAMAAYVAERVAKRPFETLIDSLILRPLGMTQSTHQPMLAMTRDFSLGHQPAANGMSSEVQRPMPGNSAEWGAGFLYTSAAEAAHLTIAMMDSGRYEGKRALSPEAIRLVTTAYVERPPAPFLHVGYGMNTDTIGGVRVWQKGGIVPGYRALITMWPAKKLAVVVIVNQPSDMTYAATALAAKIVGGIAPQPVVKVVEREPTAAERAALIGSYRIRRQTIDIHEANGRLELRRVIYSVPIRMTGTDRFVITPPNAAPIEYVVVHDSTGAVSHLFGQEMANPRIR